PTTLPTAMPGEEVMLNGVVTRSPGRVMVLQQRIGGQWRDVARRPVEGTWRFSVVARTPGARSYRVVALRTATAGQGISPTRVVTVVQPSISIAPAVTSKGSPVLAFTGRAVPARLDRQVQLWQLRGARWVSVADALQRADGSFTVRVLASAGRQTFRAVTASLTGPTAVRSPTRVVSAPTAPAAGWSLYLSDVSPHACVQCTIGSDDGDRGYATGPLMAGGRTWEKSVHSSLHEVAFTLGGRASSLSTAITLEQEPSVPYARVGPRLVEVRVDGRLRLRTFLRDGRPRPMVLDVRGAEEVRFTSYGRGGWDNTTGSDLALLTPVVSTAVQEERGVDTTTPVSELRRVAVSGPQLRDGRAGSVARTLHGGSLLFHSDNSSTAASSAWGDYDLGGRYTRLTGFPMLYGELGPGLSESVRVIGDGRLLAALPASTEGEEALSQVDVTGVRRLRLELVADRVDREMGWNLSWYVALGDPRVQ
ncbi:MAG TPA: hypothetical protein VF661_06910, partial [Actinomycetales bacterium]